MIIAGNILLETKLNHKSLLLILSSLLPSLLVMVMNTRCLTIGWHCCCGQLWWNPSNEGQWSGWSGPWHAELWSSSVLSSCSSWTMFWSISWESWLSWSWCLVPGCQCQATAQLESCVTHLLLLQNSWCHYLLSNTNTLTAIIKADSNQARLFKYTSILSEFHEAWRLSLFKNTFSLAS